MTDPKIIRLDQRMEEGFDRVHKELSNIRDIAVRTEETVKGKHAVCDLHAQMIEHNRVSAGEAHQRIDKVESSIWPRIFTYGGAVIAVIGAVLGLLAFVAQGH